MTGRDCAQETAHRKYNKIRNVGMLRGEHAFVAFLLPTWAGKVRAETKKIRDYREGEEGMAKTYFTLTGTRLRGRLCW